MQVRSHSHWLWLFPDIPHVLVLYILQQINRRLNCIVIVFTLEDTCKACKYK